MNPQVATFAIETTVRRSIKKLGLASNFMRLV
jgi:hypothetical protein